MDRVLTDFVKTLRNANIQVSPAETLDAMEVIEKVGYENRELLKKGPEKFPSSAAAEVGNFIGFLVRPQK